MNDICFVAVANQQYQIYIPWYLYFLSRSYPNSTALIYLSESLDNNIKKAINLINYNYQIKENHFREFNCNDPNTIKCLRWLNTDKNIMQFDYAHIGDIDLGICEECPSLLEQHKKHCNIIKLPYSNFVRQQLPLRLSGVHFIKTNEWFDIIMEQIVLYTDKLRKGHISISNSIGINEQFLFNMISESKLGRPPRDITKLYYECVNQSHHHGIHIRLVEASGPKALAKAINYQDYKKQISFLLDDEIFNKLSILFPRQSYCLQTAMKFIKEN